MSVARMLRVASLVALLCVAVAILKG